MTNHEKAHTEDHGEGERGAHDRDDLAALRAAGGAPGSGGGSGDSKSTTGTEGGGEYVGRVSGQDEGYAGETGAERRAGH